MKKTLILSLMLFAFFAQAQEKRKTIAVNYGFGAGAVGQGFSSKKDGGGGSSQEGQSLNTIGISYWNEIAKQLYVETGFHYLVHQYTTHSHMPPIMIFDNEIKLISIPLKIRYEAGRYIYFNSGFYVDLDISEDHPNSFNNFSGVGFGVGMGLQHYFKNGIGIYTNPQLDFRNLHPFSAQYSSEKLFNGNLVFGLAYRIK